MNLGRAIKTFRVRAGLNQVQLAERLGSSQNYLSLLEGNKRDPSWKFICRLADELKVPLVSLVLVADAMENEHDNSNRTH